MGWYNPPANLRPELEKLFTEMSRMGYSELNSIIEVVSDGMEEVEQCEQASFACCMLEQIRLCANDLERSIRDVAGCKECQEVGLPLQDGLCSDCTKNQQQKGGEDADV